MKKKVTVIQYNSSNILNVVRAFEYLGAEVKIANSPIEIKHTDFLILPGVGAFSEGIKYLKMKNLLNSIKSWVEQNKPFLGICLGMQLLFDSSEEFGLSNGLSIISGKVKKLPLELNLKVPNINWQPLMEESKSKNKWKDTILYNTSSINDFYFVHSFACYPKEKKQWLAKTKYGDHEFCSVVKSRNTYGCQFHPEKSGEKGLHILKNFLNIS